MIKSTIEKLGAIAFEELGESCITKMEVSKKVYAALKKEAPEGVHISKIDGEFIYLPWACGALEIAEGLG